MSPKEVAYVWYALLIVVAGTSLFLFLSLEATFTPTGQAITFLANPEISFQYQWDFATSGDYSYNSSLLVINGTAQLKSTTTTTTTSITEINESSLLSALEYEDDDDDEAKNRTTKVISLGSGHVELDDSEVLLEIILDQQVQNNDTLSLYLLSGTDDNGKIYLCNDTSGCNAGEYGNLTLPGSFSAGWYNLTLSGIPSLTNTLFLDSSDKIKIDMVKGYKRTTRTETNTTITYSSSASLQTADVQPANLKRWELFSREEQLNGQTISYSYSTDAGSTWMTMPGNGNLSAVTGTRLRVKVDFSSNTTDTGIIDTINLTYTTQQPCVENWTASYGICLTNDSKLLQYTDTNDCSATTSLPNDNGTYVSCDYCTPSWKEINGSCTLSDTFTGWYNDTSSCYAQTSLANDNISPANNTYPCDYCLPQWVEINGSCRKDNLILVTFNDGNACYTKTGLASDNIPPTAKNYTCDYCALNNCTKSVMKVPIAEIQANKTIFKVDAIANASTLLEIEGNVGDETVSIVQYSYNTKNETPSSIPLNLYVDLDANISNLSAVKIVVYYTDKELATAGVAEETVALYYYNETITAWQKLNSVVNLTANYVYATVPHLSFYGLFGEQNAASSTTDLAVHGGGGGSRVTLDSASQTVPAETTEVTEVVQPVLETKGSSSSSGQTLSAEAGCNYVLELSLPEQISIETGKPFEGEVVNTGTCEIPLLALELSPPLVDSILLNTSVLENIKPGAKGTFLLIRRQQKQTDFFSLTSSVISSIKGSDTKNGFIRVRAEDVAETVFEKELPVSVTIKNPFPTRSFISLVSSLTLIVALGTFFYKQRMPKRKNSSNRRK